MSIEVKNLSKVFEEQRAVDHISFNLKKGEIVGFLGPNGAGKSTTMKMITGYIPPSDGEIFVDGISVLEHPKLVQQKIGYLPEANPLYFDMYVREFLNFCAGIFKISNAQKRIDEVIAQTGLTIEEKKIIGSLSKGYKQRVGLAQALLHQPEVFILDEPTSGLDPNQIIEIRNLIKEIGKNKTVLLSTHIMQEVEALCDRVMIINKGKIVANETLQDLQKQHNNSSLEDIFRSLTAN